MRWRRSAASKAGFNRNFLLHSDGKRSPSACSSLNNGAASCSANLQSPASLPNRQYCRRIE